MSEQPFLRKCTLALLLVFVSLGIRADDSEDLEFAWSEVRKGAAIAIMRHALAPGFSDPAGFDVNDCATQRNLSEQGRLQAQAIGQMFRDNGIDDANLFSSQWCRCVDTAELLSIGEVSVMPELNSFFENRAVATEQTKQLRSRLDALLQSSTKPIVLVSHQVNISALASMGTSSGDTLIISMADDEVSVLARIPTP